MTIGGVSRNQPPRDSTAAEQLLFQAIPPRIGGRCVSAGAAGGQRDAVAALRCTPDTTAVSTLTYYLFSGPNALDFYEDLRPVDLPLWDEGQNCYTSGPGRREVSSISEPGGGGSRLVQRPTVVAVLEGSDLRRMAEWARREDPGGTGSPGILLFVDC